MKNSNSSRATALLAARRARVAAIRRSCTAAVLSTFVLAFGGLSVDAMLQGDTPATTAQVTTAATAVTATASTADTATTGSTDAPAAAEEPATESSAATDELAAATTSQS
jgi:hypothetical protein